MVQLLRQETTEGRKITKVGDEPGLSQLVGGEDYLDAIAVPMQLSALMAGPRLDS